MRGRGSFRVLWVFQNPGSQNGNEAYVCFGGLLWFDCWAPDIVDPANHAALWEAQKVSHAPNVRVSTFQNKRENAMNKKKVVTIIIIIIKTRVRYSVKKKDSNRSSWSVRFLPYLLPPSLLSSFSRQAIIYMRLSIIRRNNSAVFINKRDCLSPLGLCCQDTLAEIYSDFQHLPCLSHWEWNNGWH